LEFVREKANPNGTMLVREKKETTMSTQRLDVAARERPATDTIMIETEAAAAEPYDLPENLASFLARTGNESSEQRSCCSPAQQASCCEPSAKASCCEASTGGGCGCR
jgi:hypothetical protein